MNFLVDVNASGPVARWLVEQGHDVVRADEDILRWAVEEDRIILTRDQDFEGMIWREGKAHSGVLRLENRPRSERLGLLRDVMEHYSQDLTSGTIIVAPSKKVRIRKSSF